MTLHLHYVPEPSVAVAILRAIVANAERGHIVARDRSAMEVLHEAARALGKDGLVQPAVCKS